MSDDETPGFAEAAVWMSGGLVVLRDRLLAVTTPSVGARGLVHRSLRNATRWHEGDRDGLLPEAAWSWAEACGTANAIGMTQTAAAIRLLADAHNVRVARFDTPSPHAPGAIERAVTLAEDNDAVVAVAGRVRDRLYQRGLSDAETLTWLRSRNSHVNHDSWDMHSPWDAIEHGHIHLVDIAVREYLSRC